MQTPKGEHVVDAENYFVGPEIDSSDENIRTAGFLLGASLNWQVHNSISKKSATECLGHPLMKLAGDGVVRRQD
jgi:hypothetical protein